MIIREFNALQMQIGKVQLRIASPQLATTLNYGVTWSLGKVKSRQSWQEVVLKVEYKVNAQGICELIWLGRLLQDLRVKQTNL